MNDFQIKNERRRKAKAESRSNYRIGRQNREQLANDGAFGNLKTWLYNDCALGTSSPPRAIKVDKEDYDEGSDYDQPA